MYSITELCEKTGVTKRTVRYYIQKGLLSPPEGSNRGAYYTADHLEKLQKIKEWSAEGISLMKMRLMFEGKEEEQPERKEFLKTTLWEKLEIDDGLELSFHKGRFQQSDLEEIEDFFKKYALKKNNSGRN